MTPPAIDPAAAEQIRDGFALPSIRAAALRPLALAPYDDLRGLCLDLETGAVPDEHVLLAALAGFLHGEGCHYAALTCQTAQYRPDLRPDLHGLYVRLSAFQRFLRDLAGVADEEARAADDDDRQADVFEFTLVNLRDVCSERGRITRAEACERWPYVAGAVQEAELVGLTVDLGGDELTIEPALLPSTEGRTEDAA